MGENMRKIYRTILKERQLNDLNVQKKHKERYTTATQPAKSTVIKSVLNIQKEAVDSHCNPSPHETSIDILLQKMQRSPWSSDVVLLITPASKHSNQFKLHVIDRKHEGHLGVTSITQQELSELRTSKAFEKYSTIIGSKYIDLKTVAANTTIIANLMRNLNRECCRNSRTIVPTPSRTVVQTPSRSNATTCQPSDAKAVQKSHTHIHYPDYQTDSNMRLVALIDRINDAYLPAENDLNKFFSLAEKYKFKIYIRPELCWKATAEPDEDCEASLIRFNVECFMLFDNYVGSITMNADQLYDQLSQHSTLLPRIQVVDDVCDITPLPKFVIAALRTLSEWLGLEVLYDAFAEFVFDLYKQYA